MNKKAEAILMRLLLRIVETSSVYSDDKADLLKELILEAQKETKGR